MKLEFVELPVAAVSKAQALALGVEVMRRFSACQGNDVVTIGFTQTKDRQRISVGVTGERQRQPTDAECREAMAFCHWPDEGCLEEPLALSPQLRSFVCPLPAPAGSGPREEG